LVISELITDVKNLQSDGTIFSDSIDTVSIQVVESKETFFRFRDQLEEYIELTEEQAPTNTFFGIRHGFPAYKGKASSFPLNRDRKTKQVKHISGGGKSKVASLNSPREFWELTLENITQESIDSLYYFFNHPNINWGDKTFKWKDSGNIVRDVKLWNADIDMPITSGDFSTVNLLFLEL